MSLRRPLPSTMRDVILLGTPLLFGQITHYLHQIADSAMLGHFGRGSLELAAIGIAGLATWVLLTFLWPLSNGVQALASRRFGRQRPDSAEDRQVTGQVLDNGVVAACGAVVLATAVSFLARPVLSTLLNSQEILELAMQYIRIMRFSLIPMGLFVVAQGFLGAVNRTRPVMYAGILSNVLNIALNWVFIFGNLGFPAMGIRGAALGTLCSSVVSAAYLLGVLVYQGYRQDYRLFTFRELSRKLQRDIVRIALPPGIQNAVALSVFLAYQTLIESYAPIYLAATHSIFAYFRLNKTIIGGFARSASILAGNALGRGDRQSAQAAITASGFVGMLVALVVAALTVTFRASIAALFTNDPATQVILSRGLLFFTGFYFVEALGYAFEMVFVANGYGNYVLFSEFSTNLVFIIGATLVARALFPDTVQWAWFSFGLYQIVHAGFMIAGWMRGSWLHLRLDEDTTR